MPGEVIPVPPSKSKSDDKARRGKARLDTTTDSVFLSGGKLDRCGVLP